MSDNAATNGALNRDVTISFVAGLALGILIGTMIALLTTRQSQTAATDAASKVVAEVKQRWFIWDGAAPLIGRPFATEGECEAARQKMLSTMNQNLTEVTQGLSQLSIRQVQALGLVDRIQEQSDRANRAYCHEADS